MDSARGQIGPGHSLTTALVSQTLTSSERQQTVSLSATPHRKEYSYTQPASRYPNIHSHHAHTHITMAVSSSFQNLQDKH